MFAMKLVQTREMKDAPANAEQQRLGDSWGAREGQTSTADRAARHPGLLK
ncbi:hypothetical protein [Variovorax sp. 38R]|nr:hypothetical protein [Variovorax sp. 38R]QOF78367.1 hypothetical protein IG196_29460 [Variovorax sp. 38R]